MSKKYIVEIANGKGSYSLLRCFGDQPAEAMTFYATVRVKNGQTKKLTKIEDGIATIVAKEKNLG